MQPTPELVRLVADAFAARLSCRSTRGAAVAVRHDAAALALAAWAKGEALHTIPAIVLAVGPARWRPLLAYLMTCPRVVQQLALSMAWTQSSHAAATAAGSTAELVRWLKSADFHRIIPLPPPLTAWSARMDIASLPETFEVYRGTRGIGPRLAVQGSSWTTSRATAGAYACLAEAPTATRLVLRRTVRRDEVLLLTGNSDDEIVLPPPATADCWAVLPLSSLELEALSAERKAAIAAYVDSLTPRQLRALGWVTAEPVAHHRGGGVVLAAVEADGVG